MADFPCMQTVTITSTLFSPLEMCPENKIPPSKSVRPVNILIALTVHYALFLPCLEHCMGSDEAPHIRWAISAENT